jgi:hypothetical protein
MNKIFKRTSILTLFASVAIGMSLSINSSYKLNLSPVSAVGPYYLSGNFNGWDTTDTPMITALEGTVHYYEIDYSLPAWTGHDREFKVNPNWLGAGNLKDQGRAIGFGGSDNITSPASPESGTYVVTILDNFEDINVYKNAYLVGSINGWSTAHSSYKMSKTSVLTYTFTQQFATTDEWKICFAPDWTGLIGASGLTQGAKDLGFGGEDNITSTGIEAGFYDVTFTAGLNIIDITEAAPTTYTVTKYNGAAQIDSEVVLESAESYTPRFVYQQGYKLEGWYTDAGLTTLWTNGPVTMDMNLYAQYTAVSDFYVFFHRPDEGWGTSINAHYWWQGEGAPLGGGTTWPGDPMVQMMANNHGYVIKIDAGYNPNKIIFNDTTVQTDNLDLEPGKIYHLVDDDFVSNPFEYRLFKSWAPWDDDASDFKSTDYNVGQSVTVALKAGDNVKMNVSSLIWAPFASLTGSASSSFESNLEDDNYLAKVNGVFTFTWNQSFTLGSPTGTRTAQITADASTVSVIATPEGAAKTAAVNERIAEINTCAEYGSYSTYATFVTDTLGSLEALSSSNQAKMALMNAYVSDPPSSGLPLDNPNFMELSSVSIIVTSAIIVLMLIVGSMYIKRQKIIVK